MQASKVTSASICNWKDTHIFPEQYEVSDKGDVRSKRTGKILRPGNDKYGYSTYVLCVNGNRKTVKGHRLVATAFIENPDNKPAIDHINGIKTDNRVSNLRWVTNRENTHNPVTMPGFVEKVKQNIPKMYEASKKIRFGRKSVLVTYANGETAVYESLKAASIAIGINYGTLSEMLNGKRKQNRGFTAVWKEEP